MGALAAMSAWAKVACPPRERSSADADHLAHSHLRALAQAQGIDEAVQGDAGRARTLEPGGEPVTDHPLRNAIQSVGDEDILGGRGEVALLGCRRHGAVAGHQESRAHCDPVCAVGERGCKSEAVGRIRRHATTGTFTASSTCGSSTVLAHGSGVAAPLSALHDQHIDPEIGHFLRMLHERPRWART